ncbi:MAG: MATE family efflux transporter, partial [Lachnospiraceae bacterium]|nr:MATE family efflux transporter [Lachnospiraceae bacterium]
VFGMNNGLIPILAYNLGAQKRKRIDEALRFATFQAFCIMAVGTLTFELVPGLLLKLFNASDDMTTIGTAALRIIAIHFPLAAVGIALGSVFQAFSRSIYSLMVSLGRQLVILIPVAWLLSLTGEVTNVWWSFPIAEVVSLALTLTFFRKIYREDVATIE